MQRWCRRCSGAGVQEVQEVQACSSGSVCFSTPMMKGVGVWLTKVSGSGCSAAGRKGMKTPAKESGESRWQSAAATGMSLETCVGVSE